MPYRTVSELPPSIRENLPLKAQQIFLEAFNSAFDGTCAEEKDRDQCARMIAWAAVKRQFRRTETGEWITMSNHETVEILSNSVKMAFSGKVYENSVLQTLNRWIPDESGHLFALDAFKENVEAWNGTPVVFATEHPDLKLFAENPEAALEAVAKKTGKPAIIAGYVSDPRILIEGHPRLVGALNISDKTANALWEKGKLSLSTAFTATRDPETNKLIGDIVPNHVLIFEEDEAGKSVPKDKGALINMTALDMVKAENLGKTISAKNREKLTSILEAIKSIAAGIANLLGEGVDESVMEGTSKVENNVSNSPQEQSPAKETNLESGEDMAEIDEMKQKIETLTTELTNVQSVVAERDSKILELTNMVDTLRQENDKFRAAEKEAKFESFLQQLPPGAYHTDEQKAELRKKFEDDPTALLLSVSSMFANKKDETPATGKLAVGNAGTADTGSTIGGYDPIKGIWE